MTLSYRGGSFGGLLGIGDGAYLTNCYNIGAISTGATAAGISYPGAKAITTAQLAVAATFEGFDFIGTWKLRDDDSMPQLKQ